MTTKSLSRILGDGGGVITATIDDAKLEAFQSSLTPADETALPIPPPLALLGSGSFNSAR